MFSFGLMCFIYCQFNVVNAGESLSIYLNKLISLYTPTVQLSMKPKSHVQNFTLMHIMAYQLQVYCIAQQP
jgi:hypothetical protein